eukprot:m.366161 g.366161  ORF g.366161 m.366161 type:complete len:279 (-) comp28092_c0_seq12:2147-2983(-)
MASVDRYRNTGPLTAIPWRSLLPTDGAGEAVRAGTATASASAAAARARARPADQGRQVYAKTGVVGRARGSAYVECGNTKVTVAVYGPRDLLRTREYLSIGKLDCEFKYAPFSAVERRAHVQDDEEKEAAAMVVEALATSVRLEKYPKSLIDLHVTVLEDDGSVLAAAITCSALALADAGIEMTDLVASASVAVVDGEPVVDPASAEEGQGGAVPLLTMSYMPGFDEVCGLVQVGEVAADVQERAIQLCVQRCTQIHAVQESCLLTTAADDAATPNAL